MERVPAIITNSIVFMVYMLARIFNNESLKVS